MIGVHSVLGWNKYPIYTIHAHMYSCTHIFIYGLCVYMCVYVHTHMHIAFCKLFIYLIIGMVLQ